MLTISNQIVFTFYEVRDPKLTSDHLIHHEGAKDTAIELWKKDKTGFLSTFPFGAFAYARLDERLADSPLWQDSRRPSGRDPMDLTPQQPHVEFFNTECYFGPSSLYTDMPLQQKSAFAMITELFSPRSRGTVQLESADPTAKPLVKHNYLEDPLDLLVLAEACRLSNEIVMQGSGTRDIIKGAWPEKLTHHKYTRREEWMGFVKDNSTTCKPPLLSSHASCPLKTYFP